MKKLNAIIFDLDSTLVDVDLDFDKIRNTLGIPQPQPILEYLESINDLTKKNKLEKELLSIELDAAKNRVIIPGVMEALELLQSKEIKMAILTRNCKEAALVELEGIKHFFNPIFSREDHKSCKPEPDGILDACSIWDINPSSCLMVGDYLYDLQAGHRAGCKTAWFKNKNHPERDFTDHADITIDCWLEFSKNYASILKELDVYI